jgi:drug/metabolite transporter (DMT)-like permease
VNAPTNIAGFFMGVLTFTIIVLGFVFVPSSISAMDFLNYLAPLITLVLGYLFGKST